MVKRHVATVPAFGVSDGSFTRYGSFTLPGSL